jgi:hypothetical protein
LLHARVGCVGRFEWANPGVAIDVKGGVPGLDNMTRRKRCAANDGANMLGDNLFIADTILHGADGAVRSKDVRGLFDGATCVRALGGYDSKVAQRNFVGIGSGMQAGSEMGCATDAQSTFIDRARVVFPNVVSVNFDVFEVGQVRAKDATDCAAAYNANLHTHAVFNASMPG